MIYRHIRLGCLSHLSAIALKSIVTDDWGASHRLVIDLEAQKSVRDWKLEVDLADDYEINQIYGGEITQENGKIYTNEF